MLKEDKVKLSNGEQIFVKELNYGELLKLRREGFDTETVLKYCIGEENTKKVLEMDIVDGKLVEKKIIEVNPKIFENASNNK